ncbi:MAG: multiheme c-type cytochrome, partial [Planctomycetota bacterium]
SRTFDVAANVADLGYELTDWRVASDEILAEVRERNDLVIALSHLGAAGTTELAQRHPELDLISGTHVDGFEVPLRFVSDVPITGSTIRGARLNRVDLWFDGRLDAGADDRPWQDVSARQTPEMELATLLRGEQLLIGRELSLGTAEYATRFTGQANTKAAVLDALRSREPLPSGRKIAVVGDALPMSALRSELALSAIDDYHDAIYDHWMAEEGEVVKHPTDRFVGPKACYECHDVQYEFWKATSHSHAFETLRATRQHVDFECNSCHTVGFAAPAGFRQPNQYPGFENVQCAACHGAGGDHVKGGVSYAQQTFFPLPATACVNCHNDDHHPGFESVYPEKLGIVACPPMGAGNAALNEARLGAATAIDSGAADTTCEPFHRASSIALYLRAGENERAWQSAERWLEEAPNSVEARLWVGELALGRGDVDRAAGLARAVTKRRPNLARGWKLKAATALQSSELEEAATAFREAVSLDNADPEIAIIGARIAQANGELANAIAILEGYLESSPLAAGVVLPVLEELRAQSDR